ncbi:hypothetical protein P4S72_17725 [Vibrio sp. PP-XX7]
MMQSKSSHWVGHLLYVIIMVILVSGIACLAVLITIGIGIGYGPMLSCGNAGYPRPE